MSGKVKVRNVEVSLTDHCVLDCKACNHASPHFPARDTPIETLVRDLARLATALEAEELRVAGGEPLMHPDLVEALKAMRATGIAPRIRLYTNGALLHRAPEGMWDAIDHLYISFYPGVKYRFTREEIQAKAAEKRVELTFHEASHFALTLVNDRIQDRKLINTLYKYCEIAHATQCYLVYEGRFFRCTPPAFLPHRLSLIGKTLEGWEQDSVPLHETPDLRAALTAYLGSRKPLESCSWCLGSHGRESPNVQLRDKGALLAELHEDHSDTRALVDQKRLFRTMMRRRLPASVVERLERMPGRATLAKIGRAGMRKLSPFLNR